MTGAIFLRQVAVDCAGGGILIFSDGGVARIADLLGRHRYEQDEHVGRASTVSGNRPSGTRQRLFGGAECELQCVKVVRARVVRRPVR